MPRVALTAAVLALAACAAPGTVAGNGDPAQPNAAPPPAAGGLPDPTLDDDPPLFGGLADGDVTLSPLTNARRPGERRVALLLPLSGSLASVGQDLVDAAQLAVFDVADDSLVLLPIDTGGTPDGARAAAETAVGRGADLILGPLLAASVTAVAPVARANGLNVVAFSNDRSVAGDGVFTIGFLPREQVNRVVDYARRQGITRFAVVAPSDTYGTQMVEALEAATFASPASVVDVAYYDRGSDQLPDIIRRFARFDERRDALQQQRRALRARDDDVSRQALRRLESLETLGDLDYEAILVPAGGEEVLQLAPLMAFYDIDPARVRLLGTWLWDDPALGTEPAMVGAWFAAPPPLGRTEFKDRFADTFGRPADRRASLAYDAVALAAVLARQGTGRDAFGFDALTSANGFAGTDGIFRLLPSGSTERGLSVLEVRRGGPRELEAAPESFEPVLN